VIQHVPWEQPGLIEQLAVHQGMLIEIVLMSTAGSGLVITSAARYDGIVIMGGPMGALDDHNHPTLALERALIRQAVAAGIPVLGICLGHQLISVALGGQLLAGATEEIGIGTVGLTTDSPDLGKAKRQIPVLHWHRDNVTAPPGATVLASSPGCAVQAFRLGPTIGVQFHVELTPMILDDWLRESSMAADLPQGLSAESLRADFHRSNTEFAAVGDRLVNSFLSRVVASRER